MGHQEDNSPYDLPEWVNEVTCDPPHCPLTDDQIEKLMEDLAQVVNLDSKDMDVRRAVWINALELFEKLAAGETEMDTL